ELGSGRRRAGTALGCVRARRRDSDPRQLPRHPPRGELHPSGRHHPEGTADGAVDAPRLRPLARRDALARLSAVRVRGRREAPRPAPAGAPGGDRMTASDHYVAAAYIVFLLVLL